MVDNFDKVSDLLTFEEEGEFYQVIILVRKKDQDVPDNHQSSRTIKTYYIESLKQLNDKKEEIVKLCELFNARAGISTNVLNHKNLGFDLIRETTLRIESGSSSLAYIYDKVVGKAKSKRKRWLIDLDTRDESQLNSVKQLLKGLTNEKLYVFDTRNGYHIITKPFNSLLFNDAVKKKDIDATIHKSHFLALYYI